MKASKFFLLTKILDEKTIKDLALTLLIDKQVEEV
jgi:hypothetical protein